MTHLSLLNRLLSILLFLMIWFVFCLKAHAADCEGCGAALPTDGSGCQNTSCPLRQNQLNHLIGSGHCEDNRPVVVSGSSGASIQFPGSCKQHPKKPLLKAVINLKNKRHPLPSYTETAWLFKIFNWAETEHGDDFQQYNGDSNWPDLEGVQEFLEDQGYSSEEIILNSEKELAEQIIPQINTPNQMTMITLTTLDDSITPPEEYEFYFLFEADSSGTVTLLTDSDNLFHPYTEKPREVLNLRNLIAKLRQSLVHPDVIRAYRYIPLRQDN